MTDTDAYYAQTRRCKNPENSITQKRTTNRTRSSYRKTNEIFSRVVALSENQRPSFIIIIFCNERSPVSRTL